MSPARIRPNTIGRCLGGSSPQCGIPDTEYLVRGFGVHVMFISATGVVFLAGIRSRTADDDEPFQQLRQRALPSRRQRQVGQLGPVAMPRSAHRDRPARPRSGRLRSGVVLGETALRRWQGRVAESFRAVGLLGGTKWCAQRLLGSSPHRNAHRLGTTRRGPVVPVTGCTGNIPRVQAIPTSSASALPNRYATPSRRPHPCRRRRDGLRTEVTILWRSPTSAPRAPTGSRA